MSELGEPIRCTQCYAWMGEMRRIRLNRSERCLSCIKSAYRHYRGR